MTLIKNYNRLDVAFVKGTGSWLTDIQGEKYLDMLGGIAVCIIGHCHPKIVEVIHRQSSHLIHTSNLYNIPNQEELAAKLCEISALDKAFFCNSGTEANEAAIKLTRLYANSKNISNPKIIVFNNSFHGRTIGSLSATDSPAGKQGFEPLLNDFIFVNLNDIDAVIQEFNQHNIVGVMVEPIQGEGGIHICTNNFLQQIRKLCDQYNALLIVDEIQSGIGRTGRWFAHQYANIKPDIMTLAKSLGNGFPIGCMLTTETIADMFVAGKHGSTFGGNPLACAVSLTVLETIKAEQAMDKAVEIGDYFVGSFNTALQKINANDKVTEIRHRGCMIGIELADNCPALVQQCLKHKLLINVTQGNVIRLLPSLLTSKSEMNQAIAILAPLIKELL